MGMTSSEPTCCTESAASVNRTSKARDFMRVKHADWTDGGRTERGRNLERASKNESERARQRGVRDEVLLARKNGQIEYS
jgi:hypothetical protein